MTKTELAIEIKDLNKTYKKSNKSAEKVALKNINLEIKKGSFFGLLGPNGAGKSTIINILGGLTAKNSGTVKIAGIDIDQNQKSSKFKIGIVPQELIIDPFFNVYETLEIYAGYFGIKKSERKTEEIITALGLKDKMHATPRSLSGGMRRRLLVAKALVNSPEILVLDEPTAGVDVDLRTQLWNYVKKLNQQGTTILLTTHYLEEAEELCDEIAIINKGEVVKVDKKANFMKILSTKELIINFTQNIDPKKLELPQNLDLKALDANQISIAYDPSKINVTEIFNAVNKNGFEINDISTRQPDLENVFTHLVSNK